MAFDWSWLLVVLGAMLVLVEVSLGGFAGFDLVLIGSSFVIGGIVGLVTHHAATGYITACVLGVGYMVVGRRLVQSRFKVSHGHRSNIDAVHGQQGLVQQRIAAHEAGLIKVGDEVWRALPVAGAGPFEPGSLVTVADVDGVTLHVR